jgi:CBS domain containing-hemolysin-like protein
VSAPGVALLAIGVLLVVTGYLAAVETVVARTDVVRALRVREEERSGSEALLWLTEHRGSTLNVLLVATVTARVSLAAVAAILGWELLGDGAEGAAIAVIAVVAVTLTGAEVAPRTLVLRSLEAAGCRVAPSARLLVRALEPLARVAVVVGRALVPRREGVTGPYAPDEDAPDVHDEDEPDEELEPEERAMIRSIFELADTRVREVMVPRPDLVTVAEDASFDDVVAIVSGHGVSRIPVHDPGEPDAVVGVVYAKDLLKRVATDRRRRWSDLVRPPTFVPETKRCDELLRELQDATVHLALVIDEYGDLVGLVTIEDILEEIVGEIVDEHDQEDPLVEVLDQGWRIDARLGVDDLNQLLGAELPEEGWDTVGGLVFGTLGRIPVEGERVELGGVCLAVERVQGRRVAKVHATLEPHEADLEDHR